MTTEEKTYATEAAAKRAANKAYTPAIVELSNGSFDWFPAGHPIPQGSTIVSRWVVNQWRTLRHSTS